MTFKTAVFVCDACVAPHAQHVAAVRTGDERCIKCGAANPPHCVLAQVSVGFFPFGSTPGFLVHVVDAVDVFVGDGSEEER